MAKLLLYVSCLCLIHRNLPIFCFLILRNSYFKMHVIFIVTTGLNLEGMMHCILLIILYNLLAMEHILKYKEMTKSTSASPTLVNLSESSL